MPNFAFAGHMFQVVGSAALFWPTQSALVVADLHLEKASWFASKGQMLPPHDSQVTLERLATLVGETGARTLWCLGDNFHDVDGPDRLQPTAIRLLGDLTRQLDWHWITGNHDARLPAHIGGAVCDEAEVDGIILRHRAQPSDCRPEFSGHFHPKFRAKSARGSVTRACFVASLTKLIFPAFGALTGGLHADHPEIRAAIGSSAEALIATQTKLLRFPLI